MNLKDFTEKQTYYISYRAWEWSEHTKKHHPFYYHKQIICVAPDIVSAIKKAESYSKGKNEINFKADFVNRRSMVLVPNETLISNAYRVEFSGTHPIKKDRRNDKVSFMVPTIEEAIKLGLEYASIHEYKDVQLININSLGLHYNG